MARSRPAPLGTVLPWCAVQRIDMETRRWVTVFRCLEDPAVIRRLVTAGGHVGLLWVRYEDGSRRPVDMS